MEDVDELIAHFESKEINRQNLIRLFGREKKYEAADTYANRAIERLFKYYVNISDRAPARPVKDRIYPEFGPVASGQIANKVNYICSFDNCGLATRASDNTVHGTMIVGQPCFIYTPFSGSPRYNEKLSERQLVQVPNGIWLCKKHSTIVNLKDGGGIRAQDLAKWKGIMEKNMRDSALGLVRIKFEPNFLVSGDIHKLVRNVMAYLGKRSFLYGQVTPGAAVADEVMQTITYLSVMLKKVEETDPVARFIVALQNILNRFVRLWHGKGDEAYRTYAQYAMRMAIGVIVLRVVNVYDVKLPEGLKPILPRYEQV